MEVVGSLQSHPRLGCHCQMYMYVGSRSTSCSAHGVLIQTFWYSALMPVILGKARPSSSLAYQQQPRLVRSQVAASLFKPYLWLSKHIHRHLAKLEVEEKVSRAPKAEGMPSKLAREEHHRRHAVCQYLLVAHLSTEDL